MRPASPATLALAATATALGVAALGGVAAASEDSPHRLMATGTEFNVTLSKTRPKPGWTIVQFVNAGEDPHDLKIHRVGGAREHAIGELPSGELGEARLYLKRGSRYELWCSLTEHRERGMDAVLRVRRHR